MPRDEVLFVEVDRCIMRCMDHCDDQVMEDILLDKGLLGGVDDMVDEFYRITHTSYMLLSSEYHRLGRIDARRKADQAQRDQTAQGDS